MPLDEIALRRPTFLGGRPVTLADGQEWTIPVANRLFLLDESAPDGFRTISRFGETVDDEFAKLWKEFEDAESDAAFVRANLRVMFYMLQLNYAIDAATAAPLIPITFQAGTPDPIREAFLAAARGQEPEKPTAVGSNLL